jgi:hypothetical protein
MDTKQKCLICGSSTEIGFVLDRGHWNEQRQEEWWEGKPEKSFWTGLKKPERSHKVLTLRCTKCGYLMEFADPEDSAGA